MNKEIALSFEGRKRISSTYLKLTKPKVVALMLAFPFGSNVRRHVSSRFPVARSITGFS